MTVAQYTLKLERAQINNLISYDGRWPLAALHKTLVTIDTTERSITPRTTSTSTLRTLMIMHGGTSLAQDPRPTMVPERVWIPHRAVTGSAVDGGISLLSPALSAGGWGGGKGPHLHSVTKIPRRRTSFRRIDHTSTFRGAGLNIDICVSSRPPHTRHSSLISHTILHRTSGPGQRIFLALTTDQRSAVARHWSGPVHRKEVFCYCTWKDVSDLLLHLPHLCRLPRIA
jgi:hypothetical protein